MCVRGLKNGVQKVVFGFTLKKIPADGKHLYYQSSVIFTAKFYTDEIISYFVCDFGVTVQFMENVVPDRIVSMMDMWKIARNCIGVKFSLKLSP